MEIIISHLGTDFDGLASMVAARKIHPRAQLVFTGSQERNVREFMILYRHLIETTREKYIDFDQVRKLIIVDTQHTSRLGNFFKLVGKEGVEVVVYDHHPECLQEIKPAVSHIREYGATTTILVQEIKRRAIPISPFEATLFALGIYEDTSSLTATSVTTTDLETVAYLLKCGASLAMVTDFISRELTHDQINLLNQILTNTETYFVNGTEIVIAAGETNVFVQDLSLLTHKLKDIENLSVVFSVVRMGNRIHMVGRSKSEAVNVGQVLDTFGGGGHPTAASAIIKDSRYSVEKIKEQLLEVLYNEVKPILIASEIMTSPVKTVDIKTTIREAKKITACFNLQGLPVMEEGRLAGIITSTDMDKAMHHRLGHAPVKGFMSTEVVSITPDTSLSRIQKTMIKHNIGRLPVLKESRLIGIVTRTDLLRVLHDDLLKKPFSKYDLEHEEHLVSSRNIGELMKLNLPRKLYRLLKRIGTIGEKEGLSIYVVGGFVRDLLLNVRNWDVDIVVEGNGIRFARKLARALGGRASIHKEFKTGVVILPDGFRIDIASARFEIYEFPAALPQVETGSIRNDIYRRDFTINALAVQLNSEQFGKLFDFFGGQQDLKERVIRVLHNLSFVDDPTRIFRAVRFEQRFNFTIGEHTLHFIENSVNLNLLDRLSYPRVWNEIYLIFAEHKPLKTIKRLNQLGILRYIHPGIKLDRNLTVTLRNVQTLIKWFTNTFQEETIRTYLVYLAALLEQLKISEITMVCEKFRFSKKDIDVVRMACRNTRTLLDSLQKAHKPSEILMLLDRIPLEALVLAKARAKDVTSKRKITRYFKELRFIKPVIDGHDLLAAGLAQGPYFATILNDIRIALADDRISTPEEQQAYMLKLISKHQKKDPA